MQSVFDRLSQLLQQQDARFDVTHHEAVFTSDEAAHVRGARLSSGAKALICKLGDRFVMFVLPADRRLDSKATRKQFKARGLRFATTEEVLHLTNLKPGSIPPFGSLFGLKTYCDESLRDEPTINFNAGDHTISISMASSEYERVEQPEVGLFT